jgi:hypothetical protein
VYGILLGARRIVAIEPPAHLIADELARYNDRRWGHLLAALPDPSQAVEYDVVPLIERARFDGRAFVLLGTRRRNDHPDAVPLDAIHAHRLALSERVTLCPFPESPPGLLAWLAGNGDAGLVLSRYVFEDAAAPPGSRALPPPDVEKLKNITSKLFQKFKYHVVAVGEGGPPGATAGPAAYAVAGEADPAAARKVNDEWRRWIAGNLMLGASPVTLEDSLVESGISEQEASEEVWKAVQSPYVWGALRLQNRLKKRDWLLAVYRKLRRLAPRSAEVERRHDPSRGEFLEDHYAANRPVILTGMMDDWPALERWGLDDFARRFGDREVEVRAGRQDDAFEAGRETPTRAMTMAECAAMLRQDAEADDLDLSLTAEEGSANKKALAELWDDIRPIAEYLDGRDPSAGSLRLASAGSSVPFQHGLANTLVAQVMGQLSVKLAPSWDLPLMQNSLHVFSQLDGRDTPASPHPPPHEPQVLECILDPGEVLFVPIGWWSFFEALDVSATVTFTNFAFDNDFASFYTTNRQA